MRPQGSRVPSGDSQRPVTALPWLRSVPGGLLPLVGRTEELAVVTDALTHAAHGQGRSILITGPAGRGKSRLLAEAAALAQVQGALVITATAERGPSSRPHDVLLQVLSCAVIDLDRRRMPRPEALDAALQRLETGGDDLGRSSTLTAFTQALLALPHHPVVIIVDDVHWADVASAEILREVSTYLDRLPMVLLRAQRPDPHTRATEARSTVEVALEPLHHDQLCRLFSTRLDMNPQSADRAAELVMRLGGDTPAVLEHLVSAAGGLDDTRSAQDFLDSLTSLDATDPRRAMSVRLASLAPWTRDVLSVAAVLGSEFDVTDLAEFLTGDHRESSMGRLDIPDAALDAALTEGLERRVLDATAPGRFGFVHPLGPELLYERLAPGRRAELHRRAGHVLARRGSRHVVGAARHLLASGRVDSTTGPLIVAAGDQALARSAFEEAATFFDAALRIGLEGDDELRVLLALGRAFSGSGQRDAARNRFEDVIIAVLDDPEPSDNRRAMAIEAAIGHGEGGDFRVGARTSASLIERVLALPCLDDAQRSRLLAAQVRVSARVDRVVTHVTPSEVFGLDTGTTADRVQWSYAVRTALAHDLAREALDTAERSQDPQALLEALSAWRSVHRSPHELAERTRLGERGVELADRLGRRGEGVELRGWLAVDHLERGDRRAFDLVAGEVEATMGRFGTHRLHWLAACLRTLTAQLDGRPRDVADAATAAATLDIDVEIPGRWTAFAILLWRAGELDDDRSFSRRLSERHPDIFDQAAAAAMLGTSRWRDGDSASARELLGRSLERLRQGEHEISWLLSIHAVADLAAEIGDTSAAVELIDLLRPWQDRITIGNHGTVMLGPIARPLGRLLALTGASDAVVEDAFTRARTLGRDLRSPAFAAESLVDEARWHLERNRPGEAAASAREALRLATAIEATRMRREAGKVLALIPGTAEPDPELSLRQAAILELIAEGLSNPQIARRLAFSLSTVAKETSAIYQVLGVATRHQAASEFRRRSR